MEPSMSNAEIETAVAHLVGTDYEESVKAQITELTGCARVVGPNEISTREIDETRVHILTDDNNVITGITFG